MNYMIGIEREGIRIFPDGRMADTPHPPEFGDKLMNPLIGTDFGEAMLELRTRPCPDPESCYRELLEVTKEAERVLKLHGELLWPYSIPFLTPDENEFSYNRYPGREDMEDHERVITKIYGIKRNCISGIHVNFSIGRDALRRMRQHYPEVPEDRDEAYLRCARQILAHEEGIRYFFDASPTDFDGKMLEDDSLRNSEKGFRHKRAKLLDFSSKAVYLESLKKTKSYERLAAIRLKSKDKENFDEGIADHGIERLEFRLCDIDPFDPCGISEREMKLVLVILFTCMAAEEIPNAPKDLLSKCEDVDRKLKLGFGKEILFYQKQVECGIRKCDRVRKLIREEGVPGIIKIALKYRDLAIEKKENAN